VRPRTNHRGSRGWPETEAPPVLRGVARPEDGSRREHIAAAEALFRRLEEDRLARGFTAMQGLEDPELGPQYRALEPWLPDAPAIVGGVE
jgi:hypothetical protein